MCLYEGSTDTILTFKAVKMDPLELWCRPKFIDFFKEENECCCVVLLFFIFTRSHRLRLDAEHRVYLPAD